MFCVRIGIVKFATQLKESPCSPVVTFPSFGSEGHGVQPPQGDSFFHICVGNLESTYVFSYNLLLFIFVKKTFKVKYNYLVMSFLFKLTFFSL